jgi:o-succinylbenzoate synthase
VAALASVEVIPYALPFRDPYVTARGKLSRREMVLLRIRDGDGVEGLGEAVPLSLRGGATLEQVVAELQHWAAAPSEEAAHLVALSSPARSAVGTALLDLRSRLHTAPVWQELGAREREPVACNATLPAGEPQAIARAAAEWGEAGFTSFKLKVGVPGDLDQVAAVRRELGPGANLRVDANGAWDAAQAVEKIRAMQAAGIALVEQPCPSLEELAEVRRRVEVPIAADESVGGAAEMRQAKKLEACDLVTVKLSKMGGPDESLMGLLQPTYLSSALDGPVGIAAAAHVAQALRENGPDAGIPHGLATQRLFATTIAATECELRGDLLHLPGGPGLGVEIDEKSLERHRL